jgi:hypothetical protein
MSSKLKFKGLKINTSLENSGKDGEAETNLMNKKGFTTTNSMTRKIKPAVKNITVANTSHDMGQLSPQLYGKDISNRRFMNGNFFSP